MYHSGEWYWQGGGYVFVMAGDIWETSVPSSQFCCEPAIVLKEIKIKLIKKTLWFIFYFPNMQMVFLKIFAIKDI